MKSDYLGLGFKAIDLHVHTPGSDCYVDKGATPEDIVNTAISAGLDAICITDHNSASWVDKMSQASVGKKLIVFPGVEISSGGGKEGSIHILAIFDVGTTIETINDVLTIVGLTSDKRGKNEEIASLTPSEIIKHISEKNGIPILAHADSSHGVLHDLKGVDRKNIIQNPELKAVEITNPKTKEYLNGSDPTYKVKLPTIESSDAHRLSDIGNRRTYFKLQNINLNNLRQCFEDEDIRIKSAEEWKEISLIKFPKIKSLKISEGFFDNKVVDFHDCQNTIIGGQGVGKSLLIEFIRFALNQESTIHEISDDSRSKLITRLGIGGTIQLNIKTENGEEYLVKREFNNAENPTIVTNIKSGEIYTGNINQLFPIIAYSQTEAIFISKNQDAQLILIDSMIDSEAFKNRIRLINKNLTVNDSEIKDILDSQDSLVSIEREIRTKEEQKKDLEAILDNQIFLQIQEKEFEGEGIDNEIIYQKDILEKIKELKTSIKKPKKIQKKYLGIDSVDKSNQLTNEIFSHVEEQLSLLEMDINQKIAFSTSLYENWEAEYRKLDEEYQVILEHSGGDKKALENQRKSLNKSLRELYLRKKEAEEKVKEYQKKIQTRMQLLSDLKKLKSDYFRARKEKFDELTKKSDGKLNLALIEGKNTSAFSSKLKEIATGTNIRKTDLDVIASKIHPYEFIDSVIKKDSKRISDITNIDYNNVKKLIEWLLTIEDRNLVLSLQHDYLPEDVPVIEFLLEGGEYRNIKEVSVGQKCTALLIIALCTLNTPIIIDQPEESIDIASVVDDVVKKIRGSKENRQFIFTTHNPNIAVSADSDLILVLKSTAVNGDIVNFGSMDDPSVREDVINHLEGGKDPYLLRGKKYRLLDI